MRKQSGGNIQEIVKAAVAGDESAFDALLSEIGQLVLYRCIKLMGNPSDGEDAAQEVFINMHNSIHRLRDARAFHVWLHKLVLHVCNRQRSKLSKTNVPLEEFGDIMTETRTDMIPEAYINDAERREQLLACINALPAKMRDCMLLYYYDDMPVKDIAMVYKTSENAINVTLHRARLKIRTSLQQQDSTAYSHGLLPFSSIAALFQMDLPRVALGSTVQSCIEAASSGHSLLLLQKITGSVAAKAAAAAIAGTALVSVGIYLVSTLSGPAGIPQSLPGQSGAENIPPGVSTGTGSLSPAASAPTASQEAAAVGQSTIAGRVYIDDPAQPKGRTWVAVPGATVQLYTADGITPLSEPLAADADDGFRILLDRPGDYRVLVSLPQGALFAPSQPDGLLPIDGQPQAAWLVWQGSHVLSTAEGGGTIAGLAAVAYFPARLEGKVVSSSSADLSGFTVDLLDSGGSIVASARTEADGSYAFENPPLAHREQYGVSLRFPLPGGWQPGEDQHISLAPGEDTTLPTLEVFAFSSQSHNAD